MKWFSILAMTAMFAGGALVVQAGPDEDYISLYQAIEEGDQAIANGQTNIARDKFSQAEQALKKLKATYPSWNEKTVDFRLQYVSDRLAKLGPKATTPAPAPEVKPAVVAPPADPLADLRAQVAQLVEERKVLQAKLTEALAAQPAAIDPRELQKAQAQIASLQKEKDLLRVALEQEQAKVARAEDKSGLEKAEKEIASLKTQLAASAAPVAASEREVAALRENVRTNSLAVAALQAALANAKTERDTVLALAESRAKADAPKVVAAAKPADESAQIKDLKNERDDLLKRLNQANRELANAKIKSKNAPADRTDKQLEILRSRLEVLEARQIPYTPEELALLKSGPLTPKSAPTAKSDSKRKELPPGAGILLAEAQHAFVARRFDEAEKKYLEVLKMDDKNLLTLGNLGAVQLEQGHLADAEATLTKAQSLDPNDAFILSTLGVLRTRQDKTDEAFDLLSRAAELDPRNPETQSYLGQVLSKKGQRPAAETALRKAIEINPNYAPAHFNLAVVYATQEPPFLELAKFHYQKAIALGFPADEKVEKAIKGQKL